LIIGVKCVIVNEALKGVEPEAWDFVMNFARDKPSCRGEACLVPEPNDTKAPNRGLDSQGRGGRDRSRGRARRKGRQIEGISIACASLTVRVFKKSALTCSRDTARRS
jgi:hypothetical protein